VNKSKGFILVNIFPIEYTLQIIRCNITISVEKLINRTFFV